MISKNQGPAWEDNIFWKLWGCDSQEELELKLAVLGIDARKWWKNDVQAELEWDNIFWKQWKCDTWEEVELTAAVLGIDARKQWKTVGRMWWPRGSV